MTLKHTIMKTTLSFIFIFSLICFNTLSAQSFGNQHLISTGTLDQCFSIQACDIDNDGDNDVLATDYSDGKVLLYINIGNGEFGLPVTISTIEYPGYIKTGDIDNDGDLDILWTTNNQSIVLKENLGNGEFVAEVTLNEQINGSSWFSVIDINNDGYQDIVIAALGEIRLSVLFNNGDKTFSDPVILNGNPEVAWFQCIDFDQDQDVDIIYSERETGKTQWLENTDNGIFNTVHVIFDDSVSFSTNSSFKSFDADNDGDLDVVIGIRADSLRLCLNNGNNIFDEYLNIAGDLHQYNYLKSGDYDNDSDEDIISLTPIWPNIVLLENIDGKTFENNITIDQGICVLDYELAYINDDDLPDLIFSSGFGIDSNIGWLENSTSEPFTNKHFISSQTPGLSNVSIGDFNNDNYKDIAITQDNGTHNRFDPVIYLNTGNGQFLSSYQTELVHSPSYHKLYDDYNGDGFCDILSCINISDSDSVRFIFDINMHDMSFTSVESIILQYNYFQLRQIKLHKSTSNEIIGIAENTIHLLKYNNDFNLYISDSINIPTMHFSYDYKFSDINNDGLTDIIIGNSSNDVILIIHGENDFFSSEIDTIQGDFQDLNKIVIANINGDEYPDIVFSTRYYLDPANSKKGWLENDEGNGFVEHIFNFNGDIREMFPIDYNNDSLDEIIVSNYEELLMFYNIQDNIYDTEELDFAYISGGGAFDIDYDGDKDFISYNSNVLKESRWLENRFIVGQNELIPENHTILIYPNPASTQFSISTDNHTPINEITIYNQLGQKVINSTQISNSIDVSILNEGVYIVELTTDDDRIREKLMIRR